MSARSRVTSDQNIASSKKVKRSSKRKKAMIATWSDSDDSTTDKKSHKEANLCLMAHKNEVTSETQNKFSYNKL